MKKTISAFLILAALALAPAVSAQKIGHFNLDSMLAIMPDMKKANDDAAAFLKILETQMIKMQTELDTKMSDYDKNKTGWSPTITQIKEAELNSLNQRIQAFQASAQTDFTNKKNELVAPIMEKVKKAVRDVAVERGLRYIFDNSNGSSNLLFAEPSDDVFNLVKAKLNIPN